jgi:ATP/maltotriose-dependent transcriptional regulator MalT
MGHWFGGRCSDAGEAFERAAEHARRGGEEERLREILGWIASAHLFSSLPAADGIERCTRLLAQAADNPLREALLQRPLAFLVGIAGRADEAHALFAASARTLDELPETLAGVATYYEAELALFEGDAARALAIMTATVARLRELRERALLGSALAMLARSLVEHGEPVPAAAAIEESRGIAPSGDVLAQIQWRNVLAPLHAARGDADAALALSDETLRLTAQTDWLIGRGDALVARADVLRAAGRSEDADAALAGAADLYGKKGAVLAVELVGRRRTLAAASASQAHGQKGAP